MTKRKCPFEYNMAPHIKMHVGQKEYNMRNDTAMNKVHNKTLDILFKGAKNIYKSSKNKVLHHIATNNENTCDFCMLCNDIIAVVNKCDYCNKCLCEQCTITCNSCHSPFCKSCSVKLYLVDENCAGYCLSCYPSAKNHL